MATRSRSLSTAGTLVEDLAPRVDGAPSKNKARNWFDGFWDFVVTQRAVLDACRSRSKA